MANKVILSDTQLIRLRESMLNEVTPEVDEYEIGDEGTNPPLGGNFYHVSENLEYEVEASDVDLSSFKKRKTLNTDLWKDGDLDSRVRLKLLDIADDFWEFVNLKWVKPKGIILTGSICNYNWSDKSDIDLHLIADFDEIDDKTEFVRAYLDSKKNEWNDEHDKLRIYGFPVELYVQNVGEMPKSSGIYDLEENKWISEPSESDIKPIALNKYHIKDKAARVMTIIDDMYDELLSTSDGHKVEEIGEKASYLLKKVKEMRKKSLEKSGESGSGNIAYKALRRFGYLDRLYDLSNIVYDRTNSINESVSDGIDIFEYAKERIGTTPYLKLCGYILPDGSMLNFSYEGYQRDKDHREIHDLNYEEDGNTPTGLNVDMESFINSGAIRIDAKCGLINLNTKPTDEQEEKLIRVIRMNGGDIMLEFGDGIDYVEYDGASCQKILSDIRRFFDEGIKPSSLNESKEYPNKGISRYKNTIRQLMKEEVVADGNAEHNPYKKRWDAERKALKDFICNFGKLMTSKENGKTYKVYFDKTLSDLVGYNYCICLQWDQIEMKPKSILYIRALDKFTDRIFTPTFDDRGYDNVRGTADDNRNNY